MSDTRTTELLKVIEEHWGYRSLRPLQEPAMHAVLERRDSLVVMPTGGGKSLCYQAPAILAGGLTVVVSPLIALMKDQVDGLRACGAPAAQIDSSLAPSERFLAETDVREGRTRLLFVAPERLVFADFRALLRNAGVTSFAIDEAHCISHWGHDFRPEYRQLNDLREHFPDASVHGYTATATRQVREDICKQLSLREPEVLVGDFDRPNLSYRIIPRQDMFGQILDVLERHKNEPGIIYCLRRRDVDDVSAMLKDQGIDALPYHAGMEPDYRSQVQEAFASEHCNLIVATVAFGMGIDRSNIRFVLHAAMPKSIEHYQQETGRAGRDGLEAECVMLYSGADVRTWLYIMEKSFTESGADRKELAAANSHVHEMERYCRAAVCRHRLLVEHFGQRFKKDNCQACDLCLGDAEEVPQAHVVAQKILSCVARVKERFGAAHVVSVLRGENTEKVRQHQHDQLSTYGLLPEFSKQELRHLILQLVSQDLLEQQNVSLQSGQTAQILALNDASWDVMRGNRVARLFHLAVKGKASVKASEAERHAWDGVDRGLFDRLRDLRRELAQQRAVPAYVVFSDKTLRELAKYRPSTLKNMRLIYGVGEQKLRESGDAFLEAIRYHCQEFNVATDVPQSSSQPSPQRKSGSMTTAKSRAYQMFRKGESVDQVVSALGRARSTVVGYLNEFIQDENPADISPWIKKSNYQRIAAAAEAVGTERLKPIFLYLNEETPYDDIRLVVSYLTTQSEETAK